MNDYEIDNWRKVKKALEASGKTNSQIYARACEVLRKCGANPTEDLKRIP